MYVGGKQQVLIVAVVTGCQPNACSECVSVNEAIFSFFKINFCEFNLIFFIVLMILGLKNNSVYLKYHFF